MLQNLKNKGTYRVYRYLEFTFTDIFYFFMFPEGVVKWRYTIRIQVMSLWISLREGYGFPRLSRRTTYTNRPPQSGYLCKNVNPLRPFSIRVCSRPPTKLRYNIVSFDRGLNH